MIGLDIKDIKNGEVVKSRGIDRQDITLEVISDAIINFKDIVIQHGKQVVIFASEKTASYYKWMFSEDRFERLVESGVIVLNYKS